MCLAEFKVFDGVGLHEGDSRGVEGGEQPAAAGTALVRHRLDLINLK